MRHQGFPFGKRENNCSKANDFQTILSAQVALTALLLIGCGTLLPKIVQANTSTKTNTATVLAQNPASATVLYVNSATGSDAAGAGSAEATPFKTITYALNQAKPGTVIQLAPGTYNTDSGEQFPLFVKDGVTLRGDESTKGQSTLIIGGGEFISRTFAKQNMAIRAGNNSTITGVTVTNRNSRGTGIWVESSGVTITNSILANSVRDGIFITGTSEPKIESNIFAQNQGNGIAVVRSAKGEIRNNLFQATGFGIAVGDQSSPLISDNQILQNTGGVIVNGSAKPVLRNNVIQDSRDHGIVITQNAQPDLGTQDNPGKNLVRSNGKAGKKFFDVLNATTTSISAIGNDIDPSRISGKVEFAATTVEPPSGGVAELPPGGIQPPTGGVQPPAGGVENPTATAFKDVPANFWAKGYIEALAARGIITGFSDGSFKPNEPITRAQFATIVNKAFNPQTKREATTFSDVNNNFWAFSAIQAAYQGGFVSGYPDRSFKPQQQIPRVQALVSLANGLNLTAGSKNAIAFFNDAQAIPNYAKEPIAAAVSRGLVVNFPTVKQLNPSRQTTRAEIAAFVYQALVNAGQAQAIPSPYLVRLP